MRIGCSLCVLSLNLFFALISLGFITAPPAIAGTISPLPYTVWNAPVIIEAYAVRYGIPSEPLIGTLRCESGFDKSAVGDKGTSYGVAQIHLPAHPEVSKEEALNPWFAIDWAAYQFSIGNQNIWTCHRQLYGSKDG